MFVRYRQLIVLILLSGLLAACATEPSKTGALNQQIPWAKREAMLSSINQWHLSGKLGGQISQQIGRKQRTQAFSANVVWQQQATNYHINIFGPLGADMTQLKGDAKQATLLTSNHHSLSGQKPEQLLEAELGWTLPVSNLYYWIRGIPAPNAPVMKQSFDEYHHLTELDQQGWRIQYLQYTGVNNRYDLPSKIFISRPNLKLRLIISRWQNLDNSP